MYKVVVNICAPLAVLLTACLSEDGRATDTQGTAQQSLEEAMAGDQYPEAAWVAPTLMVDGNFPGGVLSFETAQQFAAFYKAFDATNDSEGPLSDARGTTPYSATDTSNAEANYQTFSVNLTAGQVLYFGTCDAEGSSSSGDTFLRLFLDGVEVTENDDACGGNGSAASHTATRDGVYEIHMGCYSSNSCSGTVGYSISSPGMAGAMSGARTFSADGTDSATTGFSTLLVHLTQGQTIDVGTCDLPGSESAGDTYLRLIDVQLGGNVEVAFSDDAQCGVASRIVYTAPRSGNYQVRAGCYSSSSCSGTVAYALSSEPTIDNMLPFGFHSASALLANRSPEPAGDAIIDVDYNEFVLDLKESLTEDDTLRHLVDSELQIVVAGKLYQLTNMGVFQVDMSALAAYRAWFNANSLAINTDPNFVSIPGEFPIAANTYQVMPGVVRGLGGWGLPSVKLLGYDEDAGHCDACLTSRVPGTSSDASHAPTFDLGDGASADGVSRVIGGPVTNGTDVEVGRIAYWNGKVNLHKPPNGSWVWDSDCASGANINATQYCRKFFPTTSFVTSVPVTSKSGNLWFTQNCAASFSGNGVQEWVCMGQAPTPPSCNQPIPAINHANYTLSSSFSRSESVGIGNKRFVLKARSPGFIVPLEDLDALFGFHTIYLKSKLQRKRRFLGITYWSASWADEMMLGVENMKLDTDYIVPSPQAYNTLVRPQFNKLAKYKLGNKLLDVAGITINADSPFAPLTRQDLDNWANNILNRLIGTIYTNVWKQIETDIVGAIDPSFATRYAAYTKMVDAINNDHKLRWAIGAGDKRLCNVHKINWTFNSNGGFKFAVNGGVSAPPAAPPASVNYEYTMKTGSFYGRARVGSTWVGIRMVRQ